MTGSAPFPAPERSDDAGADAERRFTTVGLDRDQWDYWSEVTRTAFVAMRAAALPDVLPASGKHGFAASAARPGDGRVAAQHHAGGSARGRSYA